MDKFCFNIKILQLLEEDQIELTKYVWEFIKTHFAAHIDPVIEIMDLAFTKIYGLINLYDIKSEYEIYSGNYGGLTKGDEIHKKTKFDTE